MSSTSKYNFETLVVSNPKEYIYRVELNRPKKLNAMNKTFWREVAECFNTISDDADCRVVVLTAAGRIFTAGLDLTDAFSNNSRTIGDNARLAFKVRDGIMKYQEAFTAIEKCNKPVIAAVHNACVGGGIDMITACDMRLCSQDAWFQVKEVDIGVAADVGTLQRLPKVIGNESFVRDLCYSARRCGSNEAKEFGLVSRIYPDKESLVQGALELAETIASKSPVAVQGTKVNLVYSRDHSVPDSLDYVSTWNVTQTEDITKSMQANMNKEKPIYSKL
ncbi:delta(3,5)-Delta(2,4)-dienoyl-CoA isomerase, mitochondrial-like [Glandiceps talaboti]